MPQYDASLVWFRRDLRSFDHAALHHALTQSGRVYCVFIYDRAILAPLPRHDRRVEFIHAAIAELSASLSDMGGALIVRHAEADEIVSLAATLGVDAVCINRDYEPDAVARDIRIGAALEKAGRRLIAFKDQVIFENDEVLSLAGKPFSVFTPYKNAWLKKLQASPLAGRDDYFFSAYPIESHQAAFAVPPAGIVQPLPTLEALGFAPTNLSELHIPTGMSGGAALLEDFLPRMPEYHDTRNFPAVKGPSYLSVHLRFGTVAIRGLARRAMDAMRSGELGSGASRADPADPADPADMETSAGSAGVMTWLSELVWRDFYFMILHHNPHVAQGPFKPEYARIRWEEGAQANALFAAWCEGRTGYPLVDAAMAQINQTGYMHNRLRMVTACFLIKDLGIDWRRGERYFAEKLNDYDLSANNGGWQWASSSGCDAQPYFRIFNPVTQSEKFDADGRFIKRYLPQLAKLSARQIHAPWLQSESVLQAAGVTLGQQYPAPVVQHDEARQRTLARYAVVKKIAGIV